MGIRRGAVRGMSLLVELMLGLMLVTVVLLAVFDLFPAADRSVGLADRTTQAVHIARAQMEQRMAMEYIDLLEGGVNGSVVVAHTTRRGSQISTEFLYRVEISKPMSTREVKDIVVSVHWQRGSAATGEEPKIRMQSSKGKMW